MLLFSNFCPIKMDVFPLEVLNKTLHENSPVDTKTSLRCCGVAIQRHSEVAI